MNLTKKTALVAVAAAAVAPVAVAVPASASPVSRLCGRYVSTTITPPTLVLLKNVQVPATVRVDAPTVGAAISTASVLLRDPSGKALGVATNRVDGNTFSGKRWVPPSSAAGDWAVEAKVTYTRETDDGAISVTCRTTKDFKVRRSVWLAPATVTRNNSTVTVRSTWYGLNAAGNKHVAGASHGVRIEFRPWNSGLHIWGPWTTVAYDRSETGGAIKAVIPHAEDPGSWRVAYNGNSKFSWAYSPAAYLGGS